MGMPVTSHELYPAVAFGADGVEHIRGTSRRGYSPKISGLSRSYRDVIDLLTASKMTLTPTIGIQGGFRLQTMRDPSWIDDARIQKLYPASVAQRWRDQTRTPATPAQIDEAARLVTPQERTVYQVVKGGGRVQHLPLASAIAEFGLLLQSGSRDAVAWDDLGRRLGRIAAPSGMAADVDGLRELVAIAGGLSKLR